MKNTSFERIVGGTDDEKNDLSARTNLARNEKGLEQYGDLSIEPYEEEKQAISTAVDYVNNVSKKYGSPNSVDERRIFLLKSGGVKEYDSRISGAMWDSFNKTIAVDNVRSNALMATHVVHEGFHATSYHSQQIDKNGHGTLYRSGIKMRGRSGEGDYFAIAQEAIIAKLSQDFFNEVICKDPLYEDEVKKTNTVKNWLIVFIENNIEFDEKKRQEMLKLIKDIRLLPNISQVYDNLLDPNKEEDYRFGYFVGYFQNQFNNILHERSEERDKFDSLLDRLVNESDGKLGSKEELFDKFTQVHFTGNYKPLAKEIEGIFGKGSFRKLAIELGNVEE